MMNEKRNDERFFFWFDSQGRLTKIYDRKYEKDYFRSDEELFDIIFDVVISQIEDAEMLSQLKEKFMQNEPDLFVRLDRILKAR